MFKIKFMFFGGFCFIRCVIKCDYKVGLKFYFSGHAEAVISVAFSPDGKYENFLF